jgi:hypothetical protein
MIKVTSTWPMTQKITFSNSSLLVQKYEQPCIQKISATLTTGTTMIMMAKIANNVCVWGYTVIK